MTNLIIAGRSEGRSTGLQCPVCGDPCAKPQEHLAGGDNASRLVLPNDPCLLYVEINKWGSRWRVMEIYRDSAVKFFVDRIGPESDRAGFAVPSNGDDHPSDWNTFTECLRVAQERNAQPPKKRERDRPLSHIWIEELFLRDDERQRQRTKQSTYGPGGHVQRD